MFGKMGNVQPLQGQDIANAILYAIEQPASVSVNEIIVRPTFQP
jgi:NADP-dependent 3-hydroxy acid dehydrogenase YdfG